MSDRKAELERKLAKLLLMREEKLKRIGEKEQKDAEEAALRAATISEKNSRKELDQMLSADGVAPVSKVLSSRSSKNSLRPDQKRTNATPEHSLLHIMALLGKVVLPVAVSMAIIAYVYNSLTVVPPNPDTKSRWWGPGASGKDDPAIKPFKINVPQERLADLKKRLQAVQLQKPLEGVNFEYGFNTDYLKKVINFWQNDYDWRSREKYLNSFPQFTTQVDGLQMHYLHVKPKPSPKHKVFPLLMIHGWPGSVREFYEIIPMLTTPRPDRDFVFEVIAPSLPGYGFSQATDKPGLSASQIGIIMKDLMQKIGFEKFYVQGGDWGAVVVQSMTTFFPDKVLGMHSNMCAVNTPLAHIKILLGGYFPSLIGISDEHYKKLYPLGAFLAEKILESGYMHLQATKPDTVGVALRDSPAGLAAYILEKFSTWTNPDFRQLADGGLTKKFRLTDLLDNLMIYWISDTITTSCRLYSETFNSAETALNLDRLTTTVPSACASFPNEIVPIQPESVLKQKFLNLVEYSEMPAGGHFAAFEEPKLLADHIYHSINKFLKTEFEKKT